MSNPHEIGSDFHWISLSEGAPFMPYPWGGRHLLFGSGRDALRGLVKHGILNNGWKRLLIPSYFCQEVVGSLLTTGIKASIYRSNPLCGHQVFPCDLAKEGDAILVVNYFGLHSDGMSTPPSAPQVVIIEDHTHDPYSQWAFESSADWCVASLRKTLPIPDGGVLWSPRGHSLPGHPTSTIDHYNAALRKFAAMHLKAAYLRGEAIHKDSFLSLCRSGEDEIASGDVSGISEWSANLLQCFPIAVWRNHKRDNQRVLAERLRNTPWLHVLQPQNDLTGCPFSCVLRFDTETRRNRVRERLIESSVYPTILWTLDDPVLNGIAVDDIQFSRRMLSIPCDFRYVSDDMNKIADLVTKFGNDAEQEKS